VLLLHAGSVGDHPFGLLLQHGPDIAAAAARGISSTSLGNKK
jgi:hypothetical protein